MSSYEYEKEKLITKVVQETGVQESIVKCWLENYQTLPCRAIQGSCKNIKDCQMLESKRYRGY